MQISYILKYGVVLVLLFLLSTVIWLWKDKEFYKSENKRQSENASWVRRYDSLKFSNQVLSTKEIEEHIVYNDPELKKKLDAANIKMNRIESLVSSTYKFRDTTKRETDVSNLVAAIKSSIPKEQAWTDTVKCMITNGVVSFDGERLKVIVTDRSFQNKSDGVAYWERRQWSFLGIKTRLFGKKVFTANSFDECGETRTLKIEKKK